MIEHSTDELNDNDPDGVDDDIAINSILKNEGEEECCTSTVAAVSLSILDSNVNRVLHKINSEVAEDGYGSDGFLPDGNLVEEETIIREEAALDFVPGDALGNNEEAEREINNFVFISEKALLKLKVDELRQELQKCGVSKTGKKTELQEKVRLAMTNQTPLLSVERASTPPNYLKKEHGGDCLMQKVKS